MCGMMGSISPQSLGFRTGFFFKERPMESLHILLLRTLRSIHNRLVPEQQSSPESDRDADSAACTIRDVLESRQPAMLARFGSTELACLVNHLGVESGRRDAIGYIRGTALPWWWNRKIIAQMQNWSGFFPPESSAIRRFCELMLADMPLIDVLGSWRPEERWVSPWLPQARRVHLRHFDPFYARKPWTHALAEKRVLVVHPFERTIQSQYPRRSLLFPDGM
ncbi:MAG: hypothetical protein ACKOTB_17065, partial [Planctomycetia bacterium]